MMVTNTKRRKWRVFIRTVSVQDSPNDYYLSVIDLYKVSLTDPVLSSLSVLAS